MMSLEAFAGELEKAITTLKPKLEIGLDRVGELAETLAASYPGHYQPGWKPLAESTLKDKAEKGFAVPSPLKRTGDMAGSVQRELHLEELAVVVGSKDKVALWQEMGTSRGIPPRPFIALGMMNALPFAKETFGKVAVSVLTGKALTR